MVDPDYKLRYSPYGTILVPYGPLSSKHSQAYEQHDCTGLILNHTIGCEVLDLSVLRIFKNLRYLDIIQADSVSMLSEVPGAELKFLSVNRPSYACQNLDAFPHLIELNIHHTPQVSGYENLSTIRSASIWNFPANKLPLMSVWKDLRRLWLTSSDIVDCALLSNLANVREIEFRNCGRLSDVSGLVTLKRLSRLSMRKCSVVGNVCALETMNNLIVLILEDCKNIESINCLMACSLLEVLHLAGRTVVKDGDLACLRHFPSLRVVSFADRKHYNVRRKALHHLRDFSVLEPIDIFQ